MSSLLFVSPALPRPTGNGLRMRAWHFLRGAADEHRVTLVAGSPSFPAEDREPREHLEPLVERLIVLPWRAARAPELLLRRLARRLGRAGESPIDWASPTAAHRRSLAELGRGRFDRVHVFRLYMLPVALEILGGDIAAIDTLDLDDWESETRAAIGALEPASASGRGGVAAARAYARVERAWLPRLRRVIVCSEADRLALVERHPGVHAIVVPNAISVPREPPPPSVGRSPVILFVGSLGYEPNADAVRFFARDVLPLLRGARENLRLDVVGGGAPRALVRLLDDIPGVRRLGALPSIDAAYAEAHLVVVPLRAGGGTRLKVLEAFARARTVVSTAVGVAGLDVVEGVHYVRAESPAEWAASVLGLLDAPARRAAIATAARLWVLDRSLEDGVARVTALFAASPER